MELPNHGDPDHPEPLHGAELKAAVDEILALKDPEQIGARKYVKTLFHFAERVSSSDFPAVLDALHASGKKDHERIRTELLSYWVERDLNSAWRYIVALPARDRDQVCGVSAYGHGLVIDILARVDPERLLSWPGTLPGAEGDVLRDPVRSVIAEVYGQRDCARGMSLLFGGPEGTATRLGSGDWKLFAGWAAQDPAAAAEMVTSFPAGDGRWRVLSTVCNAWGRRDRDSMLRWARELPDPNLAQEAALAIAQTLTAVDPAEAVKFAVERGVTEDARYPDRAELTWIEKDKEGAVRWMRELPDSPVRTSLLTRALLLLATADPQMTLRVYREESARAGGFPEGARAAVVALVSSGDTGAAVSLLMSGTPEEQLEAAADIPVQLSEAMTPLQLLQTGVKLPAGPVRDAWVDKTIEGIAIRNGTKTLQGFLEQLPSGPDRIRAGEKAVEWAFQGVPPRQPPDGEVALQITQTLGLDRGALLRGVSLWLDGTDRTAAIKWVEQSREFSAEERQRLLQPIQTVVAAPPARAGHGAASTPAHQIPRP